MGMWTQLGAVIVYFMISRMWQRNDWIVILTLPVSTIVFFLGYMNKFGLCLVDKEIINSSFISTVGNINWYCGYLVTVLFGGVYLLWWMGSEITWKRALLMGYVTIGFASLVTQGSSSGVQSLPDSFRNSPKFRKLLFLLCHNEAKDQPQHKYRKQTFPHISHSLNKKFSLSVPIWA
jgi:hypothetical protein